MKTTQEQLIEKQKELIRLLDSFNEDNDFPEKLYPDIRDEIAALEKQIEQPETAKDQYGYPLTYASNQVSPYEGQTTLRPESPLRIGEMEVEEWCDQHHLSVDNRMIALKTARWIKEQSQASSRDELLECLEWFRCEIGDETMANNDYFVDKYLKHKSK
jgi:hypothetical protein